MLAPWTRDGRVEVQVVNIAPEVAGTVIQVPVRDIRFVRRGDVLFAIDPSRFRLAAAQAEASLNAARLELSLREAGVKRRTGLTGVASAEEQERYRNTAAVAAATVASAQAALDLARRNLRRSTLYAPANGWVTHLRLRVGDYASARAPRVALVDADSFRATGDFEETKLHGIHVGDPARMKLMGYDMPLPGHVESIGRGIDDVNDRTSPRGLPTVNPVFTWVRLAQRIPVRVEIDRVPETVMLAAGDTCSASVGPMARPPGHGPGRLLAWLQDRL